MQGIGMICAQHDQFPGDSGPTKNAESMWRVFLNYYQGVELLGEKGGWWG